MIDHTIRPAVEDDRWEVAATVVRGFGPELDGLVKDRSLMEDVIRDQLDLDRFAIADVDGQVVGVVARSDARGRALNVRDRDFVKAFGPVRGSIAAQIFKFEFSRPLALDDGVDVVEHLTVEESHRHTGVATALIEWMAGRPGLTALRADVPKGNEAALACFTKAGFQDGAGPMPSVSHGRRQDSVKPPKHDMAEHLLRQVAGVGR